MFMAQAEANKAKRDVTVMVNIHREMFQKSVKGGHGWYHKYGVVGVNSWNNKL